MSDIVFLHTGELHVQTFEALIEQVAPKLSRAHHVNAALLDRAQVTGIDTALHEDIQQAMYKVAKTGAKRVVCTCSSIGNAAEQAGQRFGFEARRIDRPMAKEAVRKAHQIAVFAALKSTLSPTDALLKDEAEDQNKDIVITHHTIQHAWPFFESGDLNQYHASIAETLNTFDLSNTDVIVLAQASMANASKRVELNIPVLSSAQMGLEAICKELNTAT